MTVIMGVLCKDGVVVGADSAVTFGGGGVYTIRQATEKVHTSWYSQICERVICLLF